LADRAFGLPSRICVVTRTACCALGGRSCFCGESSCAAGTRGAASSGRIRSSAAIYTARLTSRILILTSCALRAFSGAYRCRELTSWTSSTKRIAQTGSELASSTGVTCSLVCGILVLTGFTRSADTRARSCGELTCCTHATDSATRAIRKLTSWTEATRTLSSHILESTWSARRANS